MHSTRVELARRRRSWALTTMAQRFDRRHTAPRADEGGGTHSGSFISFKAYRGWKLANETDYVAGGACVVHLTRLSSCHSSSGSYQGRVRKPAATSWAVGTRSA